VLHWLVCSEYQPPAGIAVTLQVALKLDIRQQS
jgi:hypothetical protein